MSTHGPILPHARATTGRASGRSSGRSPRRAPGRAALGAVLAATVLLGAAACSSDDGSAEEVTEESVTDVELEETETTPRESKPEVQVPAEAPTELVVTELIPGEGPQAAEGDYLIVDYIGVRTADGTEFDNSYERDLPFTVPLGSGQVIPGWDTGLIGSQAGQRLQLDIPAELAYGDAGAGEIIQPGDALSFVIDVRRVIPAVAADEAPVDVEVETSSGATEVVVEDVIEGTGDPLGDGDLGVLHALLYRGSDLEAVVNTWEVGQPILVVMVEGQTLPGLIEGMTGMKVGGRRIITVPAAAAFGETGNEQIQIGPGEDLVLVVDLMERY